MRLMVMSVALLSALAGTAQQSPVPADEEPLHKVAFKNDYVEVLKVSIPPGQSTLFHTHSHDGAVIRLTGAELTEDLPGQPTAPATKTLPASISANPYAATPHTHRVNNVGRNTFEVLDIEALKRPDGAEVPPFAGLAAENPSMRVYRWELEPAASSPEHTHERPYLIVAATPMLLKMTAPDGRSVEHEIKAGDFHYVDSKVTHRLSNQSDTKGTLIEVELK